MSDYLEQMRQSIRIFERAERTFAERNRYWVAKEGPGYVADQKASTDALRRRAQSDASYYSRRAAMYALASLAEQGGSVPAGVDAPLWPYGPECAPEGGVYRGEVR